MRIIWRWKTNLGEYVGRKDVVGIQLPTIWKKDYSLFGRDGWVGFVEEDKKDDSTNK